MASAALGLISNFARCSKAFCRQLKADPAVKRLYKALIGALTHEDLTEIVVSLSSLASLLLNEPLGQKLFNRENIDQTLEMTFNVIQECLGTHGRGGPQARGEDAAQFWVFANCIDLLVSLTQSADAVAALAASDRFRGLLHSLAGCLAEVGEAVPSKVLELFASLCDGDDKTRTLGLAGHGSGDPILHRWAIEALDAGRVFQAAPFGRWMARSTTWDGSRAYTVLSSVVAAGPNPTASQGSTVHHAAVELVRRAILHTTAARCESVSRADKIAADDLCVLNVLCDALAGREAVRIRLADLDETVRHLVREYVSAVASDSSDPRRLDTLLQGAVSGIGIMLLLADGEGTPRWQRLPDGWDRALRDGLASARFGSVLFSLRATVDLSSRTSLWRIAAVLPSDRRHQTATVGSAAVPTVAGGSSPARGLHMSDLTSSRGGNASHSSPSRTGDAKVVARLMHGLREKDMKSSEILSLYESKFREFETKESQHLALLDAKTAALHQADGLVGEYRTRQAELNGQFESLRRLLQGAEKRAEDAAAESAGHRTAKEQLARDVGSLQANEAALRQDLASAATDFEKTVTPLRESECRLEAETSELRDKLEAELGAAIDAAEERTHLKERLSVTTNLCAELRGSVHGLTKLQHRQKDELSQVHQSLIELQARADWLSDEHATAVAASERVGAENSAKDVENKKLAKRVQELEEKLGKHEQIAAMIHAATKS